MNGVSAWDRMDMCVVSRFLLSLSCEKAREAFSSLHIRSVISDSEKRSEHKLNRVERVKSTLQSTRDMVT